jgi:hypothetical protein
MDAMDGLAAALAAIPFPTPRHRELALALGRLFAADADTRAILLGGSLARGRGHPASDLDLLLLVPSSRLARFRARDRAHEYARLGADGVEPGPDGVTLDFGGLAAHVWMTDGRLRPRAAGPVLDDPFEREVAALYVNARPLLTRGGLHARLAGRYLPFYGEDLRRERLARLAGEFAGHCAAVEGLAARGLGFAALERLLTAFRALVLGLFLARARYPLDLLKHLEEQVAEGLGRSDLLPRLRDALATPALDAATLTERVGRLRRLWAEEVRP